MMETATAVSKSAKEIIQALIDDGHHREWCPAFKHRFQDCQCGRQYAVDQAKAYLENPPDEPAKPSQPTIPVEDKTHESEKMAMAQTDCAMMRHALRILVKAVEKRRNFWLKLQGMELPWIEIHAKSALQHLTGVHLYATLQAFRNPENWAGAVWRGAKSPPEMLEEVMGKDDEALDFNSIYSEPI